MLTLANLAAWIMQTAILVAVALVAIRLLRLDAPAVRYHFLRVLLVICLALPFVQPRVEQPAPRRQTAGSGVSSRVRPASGRRPPSDFGSTMPVSLPDAVLMVVATGVALRLALDRRGILAPSPAAPGWRGRVVARGLRRSRDHRHAEPPRSASSRISVSR